MRVFALSDIHVDYDVNLQWVRHLSRVDYVNDVLILAGDVSHRPALLSECLTALAQRFRQVLFVPGNHDLWILDDPDGGDSFLKFARVRETVLACGASMEPLQWGPWFFMPLLGWYDYSFGEPGAQLKQVWADFRACRWPAHMGAADVAARLDALNPHAVAPPPGSRVITFSHFMPRPDLIPAFVPSQHRMLDPVLGSTRLETALRKFRPEIHVYGHSHINRSVMLDGVRYVNNAFGYPQETRISSRQLLCVAQG